MDPRCSGCEQIWRAVGVGILVICVCLRLAAKRIMLDHLCMGAYCKMTIHDQLTQNLNDIRDQMRNACGRSGRSLHEVRLIAVTKYAEWPWVEALSLLHQSFGENRPQQLADRLKGVAVHQKRAHRRRRRLRN